MDRVLGLEIMVTPGVSTGCSEMYFEQIAVRTSSGYLRSYINISEFA